MTLHSACTQSLTELYHSREDNGAQNLHHIHTHFTKVVANEDPRQNLRQISGVQIPCRDTKTTIIQVTNRFLSVAPALLVGQIPSSDYAQTKIVTGNTDPASRNQARETETSSGFTHIRSNTLPNRVFVGYFTRTHLSQAQ